MKEVDIKEESVEKDRAINSLYAEKVQLEKKCQALTNMYCFTLGIAVEAQPDNEVIREMAKKLFGGDNGFKG